MDRRSTPQTTTLADTLHRLRDRSRGRRGSEGEDRHQAVDWYNRRCASIHAEDISKPLTAYQRSDARPRSPKVISVPSRPRRSSRHQTFVGNGGTSRPALTRSPSPPSRPPRAKSRNFCGNRPPCLYRPTITLSLTIAGRVTPPRRPFRIRTRSAARRYGRRAGDALGGRAVIESDRLHDRGQPADAGHRQMALARADRRRHQATKIAERGIEHIGSVRGRATRPVQPTASDSTCASAALCISRPRGRRSIRRRSYGVWLNASTGQPPGTHDHLFAVATGGALRTLGARRRGR
jgi:hypothetical protein